MYGNRATARFFVGGVSSASGNTSGNNPMRIPHYLRRAPSGRWQFIQRVPADLADWFGKRWLKHMLTPDQRAAQVGALALASQYAWAFARIRAGAMSKDEEKALRAGLAALYGPSGDRGQFKIKPGPHGPELETDGTEQDNAAGAVAYDKAMERWERIEQAKATAAAHVNSEAYQRAVASINAPNPELAKKTPALNDQIVLYFATEHDGKRAQTMKTRRRVADAFADFHEVGKDRPVGEISKAQVVAWLDHLRTTEALSKPSVANYASHLRVIFGWMVERGTITTNPFERVGSFKPREKKQRRAEGFGWEPFDMTQLRGLFAPENLKRARMDHVRWGAMIGLYTGARVGEVAQLVMRDFEERDGVPCIVIRAEGVNQSIKTDQSERLVPIHPDLIRLGLLDAVAHRRAVAKTLALAEARDAGQSEAMAELAAEMAAAQAQFFSIRTDRGNGRGDTISKGFTNLLKVLSIQPKNSAGTVGFHSFRKTMIQHLQGTTKVGEELRRAYTGHEPGDDDSHATNYMRPWTADELAAVFAGIRWGEWLDTNGLRPVLSSGQKGQRRAVKKAPAQSKKKAKSGLAGKKK